MYSHDVMDSDATLLLIIYKMYNACTHMDAGISMAAPTMHVY